MIFKSKEIRWFFKQSNEVIAQWFADQGNEFSKTESRTDIYLSLPGKKDIGVKLREGKIEIKQRLDEPELYHLKNNAHGYLEDWIKWSSKVSDVEELVTQIINNKKYNWVEVFKARMGKKFIKKSDGTIRIVDIQEKVDYGCQIEYTRVLINNKEYFTFGLEWFGDKYLELDSALINSVLGESKLELKDSMGYSAFLKTL